MDVDAVLARQPAGRAGRRARAHQRPRLARNEKRWQDVDELLDAGIDVISTVNIQHLESLNDVVEAITGVRQRETVPGRGRPRAPTRSSSSTCRPRRCGAGMAHGNIYAADQIDAALANYFRPGNLSALRELALLWLADRVDEALERYRADARHRGDRGRPASGRRRADRRTRGRDRCCAGPPGSPAAAPAASCSPCHVVATATGSWTRRPPRPWPRTASLVEELGGTYPRGRRRATSPRRSSTSPAASTPRRSSLGTSRRTALSRLMRRGVGEQVAAASGDIDVHLVTHTELVASTAVRGSPTTGWVRGAAVGGWLLATVGVARRSRWR